MSRWLMAAAAFTVLGILGSILTVVQTQYGLGMNLVVASLLWVPAALLCAAIGSFSMARQPMAAARWALFANLSLGALGLVVLLMVGLVAVVLFVPRIH
jgi:hypothetical protein